MFGGLGPCSYPRVGTSLIKPITNPIPHPFHSYLRSEVNEWEATRVTSAAIKTGSLDRKRTKPVWESKILVMQCGWNFGRKGGSATSFWGARSCRVDLWTVGGWVTDPLLLTVCHVCGNGARFAAATFFLMQGQRGVCSTISAKY